MTLHRVVASRVPSQPWRNGGGRTRELLAWPTPDAWALRISVADIETDGPFSAFPGVTRWFAVVEGAGVTLSFAGESRRLQRCAAPLCFDGGLATDCRLLDGPTRDLNLMLRAGNGAMRAVESTVGWAEGFAVRGLYTESPGRWSSGDDSLACDASTLLWSDDRVAGAAWHFRGSEVGAPLSAWWLGFTPATAQP